MAEIIYGDGERDGGAGPSNLVIPTDQIPPAAWQAIYYHLSKKVEVNRKLHSGAFEISKDSIVDLIERLNQCIVGYAPQAQKIEFSLDFRNDTSQLLSSLEKFLVTDISHKRSATKRIAIDFDFIICPATELSGTKNPPMKFKCFLLLDQDFFSDDEDPQQAGFFPDGIAGKNILNVIEYSDYAISRALQNTVDEWVATLPKRAVPKLLKTLPRGLKWLRGGIPAACGALATVPFLRFARPADTVDLAESLLMAAFVILCTFGATKLFVQWSLEVIAKIQPTTYLLLTSGDFERKVNIERKISRRFNLFHFAFTALIVSFFVGTLSSIFAGVVAPSK